MADALADVLKEQGEKIRSREESRGSKERKNTSPGTWLAFLIFAALSAYVWVGSPAWLEPERPTIPPTLVQAGLRMEIFNQALMVEEFRETQGRLPRDLAEAGDSLADLDFRRIGEENYSLATEGPLGPVQYVSTDSLELFLGDAVQVIRQGG
jgi:hypothetical protein